MAQLKLKTDDGKEYILSFDRKTVKRMEKNGFRIEDTWEHPVLGIPELFHGAFQIKQQGITREQTEKILEGVANKEALIMKLIEMYQEPVDTLFNEPKEEAKNATWEVV